MAVISSNAEESNPLSFIYRQGIIKNFSFIEGFVQRGHSFGKVGTIILHPCFQRKQINSRYRRNARAAHQALCRNSA